MADPTPLDGQPAPQSADAGAGWSWPVDPYLLGWAVGALLVVGGVLIAARVYAKRCTDCQGDDTAAAQEKPGGLPRAGVTPVTGTAADVAARMAEQADEIARETARLGPTPPLRLLADDGQGVGAGVDPQGFVEPQPAHD